VKGAVVGQVAAMVSARVGWKVSVHRVDKLKMRLVRGGWAAEPVEGDGGAQCTPELVDLVAGEEWRTRPGWTLRGEASNDLFAAVVPVMGVSDGVAVMLLPRLRTWDRAAGAVISSVPERIALHVYPTGEPCGALVREDDRADGLPVYRREN
jgi:hypothetical protein